MFEDIDDDDEIKNEYKTKNENRYMQIRKRSNSVDTHNLGIDKTINTKILNRCRYDEYFNNLSKEEQINIIKKEMTIYNQFNNIVPLRYRIINSSMDNAIKYAILNKIDQYESMSEDNNEYSKLQKWIDGVSRIPFCQYATHNINDIVKNGSGGLKEIGSVQEYLNNVYQILDETIYGQTKVKNKIVEIIAQWISNPSAKPQIIALEGPPGVGKTSLIKNGVSIALKRPFAFYALGGASDISNLEGHSYTYEGAIWGQIVDMLMQTKVMNPIIFFDELDKISGSAKGSEINGLLTHIIDSTQNNSFQDKYFSGINIDLSRVLFFFSFNDIDQINPIVRDRLTIIKFEQYTLVDKIIICKKYLIPEIMENIGFTQAKLVVNYDDDKLITHIIKKSEINDKNNTGIRSIKKFIENIFLKINFKRFVNTNPCDNKKSKLITFPFTLTVDFVDNLCCN